jgi:hypothetical protein
MCIIIFPPFCDCTTFQTILSPSLVKYLQLQCFVSIVPRDDHLRYYPLPTIVQYHHVLNWSFHPVCMKQLMQMVIFLVSYKVIMVIEVKDIY